MILKTYLSILTTVVMVPAAFAQADSFERIAEAYGLNDFHRIQRITYTFNVEKPDLSVSRTWSWEPETGMVYYRGQSPEGRPMEVNYNHKLGDHQDNELLTQVDHWFVNDQYWLLFPFVVHWDDSVTIERKGRNPMPISGEPGEQYAIIYPEKGGYTPGDVYEVFVDDQGLIAEWIFRKGGAETPTLISTWEEYKDAGPIKVSTQHRNADGSFKLWFTDVEVSVR